MAPDSESLMRLLNRHSAGRVVMFTAVSSAFTLVFGVLMDQEALQALFGIPRQYAIAILIFGMIGLFVVGCLLTIAAAVAEARALLRKADASEKEVRRHHCVPKAVTLHSRAETFCFDDDKNCMMECNLDVEVDDHLRFLHFPFYAEYHGSYDAKILTEQSPGIVNITSATIDGVKQSNVVFEPVERRSPYDPAAKKRDALLYGFIKLSLPTQGGKRRFDVSLSVHLKGAFPELAKREYIIVEVPYYTEQISVRVKCDEGNKVLRRVVLQSSNEVPHLVANMAEVRDHIETSRQLQNVQSNNQSITWKSTEPLLGHRYHLYFSALGLS